MSDLVEIGAMASCMAVGASGPCKKACDGCRRHMLVGLQAIEKAGHRIVPIEPTEDFAESGSYGASPDALRAMWRLVLAAAPRVTAAPTLRAKKPLPAGMAVAFDKEDLSYEYVGGAVTIKREDTP